MFSDETWAKIKKIIRWSKVVAKFAAIGTTITGAVTAATSGSATTGFALGAAGATTYAATKSIPVNGYEKTKHISPLASKPAEMHRALKVGLVAATGAPTLQRDSKMEALKDTGYSLPRYAAANSPIKTTTDYAAFATGNYMGRKPVATPKIASD